MSRITNDNPPKRGEQLTSTELNQVFTEVNDAFPMDGDNVRNEGIEQPSFNLSSTSGKSGIILIAADDDDDSGSTTVTSNESTVTLDPSTTVHEWTLLQTFNQNKVIRVYWQFENSIVGQTTGSSIIDSVNAYGWAIWLEWKLSSSGAYEPVPNQDDFEQELSTGNYGSFTENTYASTIVNHVYIHEHSGSTDYDFPPDRTAYGCWWYKADQNYTIYGLRLRCRGILANTYITSKNAWVNQNQAVPTNNEITIGASNIAYMIMEEK